MDFTAMELATILPLLCRQSDRLERIAAETDSQGLPGHAGVYREMLRENKALVVKVKAACDTLAKEAR